VRKNPAAGSTPQSDLGFDQNPMWDEKTFQSLTYEKALDVCRRCKASKGAYYVPFEIVGNQLVIHISAQAMPNDRSSGVPVYTPEEIEQQVLPAFPEGDRKGFLDTYRSYYMRQPKPTGITKVFFKARPTGQRCLCDVPVFEQDICGGDLCSVVFAPRCDGFQDSNRKLTFEIRGITMLYRSGEYTDLVSTCCVLESGDRAFNGLELDIPEFKPSVVRAAPASSAKEMLQKVKKARTEAAEQKAKEGSASSASAAVQSGRDALGAVNKQ
jgi:hypothetical protein